MRKAALTAMVSIAMFMGLAATASHNTFTDVPEDHLFFNGIEWAAANGITVGCGDGTRFCPDAAVTRGQMVTFLKRFHDRFLPFPSPPSGPGAFGAGTWRVGVDIAAGTYRNTDSSGGCYWERLSGFSGETSDIITNDITFSPAIVTIEPTDVGFHSEDCGNWIQS